MGVQVVRGVGTQGGLQVALEGVRFVGIEREAEYLEIARRRIEHAQGQNTDLPLFPRAE